MKRIALLMGLAVIALSSCTKDSVKEINTGHAIDFRVSAQTRAAEITTGNLQTFYVTALNESGVTYFEDLAFIRSANDVFISTPSYFWPTTGSLSFYAYAPSANELNGTLEISSTAKTITGFSPAGTIADQKDFVVAKATGNKAANQAGVALEFGHMLSQVEVHAKNLHDGYTYLVKGVKICNIASQADFSFTDLSWNLTDGVYSDYVVYYNTPVELGVTAQSVMEKVSTSEGEISDNAMLLPQNLASNPSDKKAKIGLYVNAVSKTGMQVFPENGDYDWMEVAIDTEWEAGNRYVYTLDLTQGAALGEPIKFTMNVTPWNEKSTLNDEDIDLTGTWRMARIERTITYNDERPKCREVYDTKEEILDHLNENLYVVAVRGTQDYYIYPGDSKKQMHFTYEIVDGNLTVNFPEGGSETFLIRDISDNFVTYTKVQEHAEYIQEDVYSYIRIEDIVLASDNN